MSSLCLKNIQIFAAGVGATGGGGGQCRVGKVAAGKGLAIRGRSSAVCVAGVGDAGNAGGQSSART